MNPYGTKYAGNEIIEIFMTNCFSLFSQALTLATRGNTRKKCIMQETSTKILTTKIFLVFLPRETQIRAWPILLSLPTLNRPFRIKASFPNQYRRSSGCIPLTALSSALWSWSLLFTQTSFSSRNNSSSSTIDISMNSVLWTVLLNSSIVKWPIICRSLMVRESQILTPVNWVPFPI